jgi:hypothetical protein
MAALTVYWGTALFFGSTDTPESAYFNLLADAFLHGRLYLIAPPSTIDLTLHEGKWYVAFPPLPAIIMLPWVAIAGVESLNTVFFTALFGAANVALVFLLLTSLSERRWTQLSRADNLWLTLLFSLGSVHWSVATVGMVWQLDQICAVTFVALAVWLSVERASPWSIGAALGLAMAARPHVALTWPLLLAIAAIHHNPKVQPYAWRPLGAWAVKSAVPMLGMTATLLLYNKVRFGNLLDFGYLDMNIADVLRPGLQEYGQFSLHFLPKNFWAMWLATPVSIEQWPFLEPNPWGMSLLLTTPALVYLSRASSGGWLAAGAWTSFALLMIPLLLYYSTGWIQFGYRYSLDFMVPVMVLMALAAGKRVSTGMRCLILAGVLVNFAGVVWLHTS